MKKLSFTSVLLLFLFINVSLSLAQSNYTILVSFDGFRWDYPNRGLSPNLDFIKENGVSALSLRPSFPSKTFPNHYTIVTGMYPENHGIIANSFVDPFTNERYRISDTNAVTNPKWYKGEAIWETAKRQGVITASYFWPGSELTLPYRRPDYYEKYEHTRDYNLIIKGVLDWLQLPYDKRPKFITVYFDATDSYGHNFGTQSPEVNAAIMNLDSLIGKLFDGLKKINLFDSTNVIVLSDHGMADVSKERIINVEEILSSYNCKYLDDGPIMYVIPDENQKDEVYNKLKSSENHYKVYWKKDMPEHYHFSKNPFIPNLIIIADPGWSLLTEYAIKKYGYKLKGGNHGYDNNYIDLNGIFFAEGPDFKKGYRTGTLFNIDIYPLLAKLLHIVPNNNIDGRLDRIDFLLK